MLVYLWPRVWWSYWSCYSTLPSHLIITHLTDSDFRISCQKSVINPVSCHSQHSSERCFRMRCSSDKIKNQYNIYCWKVLNSKTFFKRNNLELLYIKSSVIVFCFTEINVYFINNFAGNCLFPIYEILLDCVLDWVMRVYWQMWHILWSLWIWQSWTWLNMTILSWSWYSVAADLSSETRGDQHSLICIRLLTCQSSIPQPHTNQDILVNRSHYLIQIPVNSTKSTNMIVNHTTYLNMIFLVLQ